MPFPEFHRSHRTGWLRASVLGANDGIVSVASLVVGVASADAAHGTVFVTGLVALVAGALSMAVGEYSSVSSQRDAELADLDKERRELATMPEGELAELAAIYRKRGLSADLAHAVAVELTAHDALTAHARDELGFEPDDLARPVQAALVSAVSFAVGAVMPLLTALTGRSVRVPLTFGATIIGLALLGSVGARLGGATPVRGALRVCVLGALGMLATMLLGRLTGSALS